MRLYDETGALLSDHSGVQVSLYEDETVSTLTAANGSFTLANVLSGPHRLVMKKRVQGRFFGTYYTNEINTTDPVYSLPQPVALGLQQNDGYTFTYIGDRVNQRLIIRGQRLQNSTFATQSLYHRVFLGHGVGYHGVVELSYFKYSRLYRNNLPNGFADTISYAAMASAGITGGTHIAITSDNPRADSCIAPFTSSFPNDNRIVFAKAYPATVWPGHGPFGVIL
ncbi:hypothetical protein [Hymenobacter saemangeumensis]|uniref:hypothetical protein n=1 Tax=Hymenobacter saemangeumensis TaxID=1084522 RepID=UPI0031EF4397